MSKRLIYAENAIDAICKACSMEGDYHKCNGYPETSTWCDELVALRAVPSAQPEIIFCKDCKWSDWYDATDGHRYCYCMETGAAGRTADDFCSYAEREEA